MKPQYDENDMKLIALRARLLKGEMIYFESKYNFQVVLDELNGKYTTDKKSHYYVERVHGNSS